MTFSITDLTVTLSQLKRHSILTLGINIKCRYAECHYSECLVLFLVMLNAIILSVFMLSVIILNVVILRVVAPKVRLLAQERIVG